MFLCTKCRDLIELKIYENNFYIRANTVDVFEIYFLGSSIKFLQSFVMSTVLLNFTISSPKSSQAFSAAIAAFISKPSARCLSVVSIKLFRSKLSSGCPVLSAKSSASFLVLSSLAFLASSRLFLRAFSSLTRISRSGGNV